MSSITAGAECGGVLLDAGSRAEICAGIRILLKGGGGRVNP